jgi:hypothetical protein
MGYTIIDLEYSCDASCMFIFNTFFIMKEVNRVVSIRDIFSGEPCESVDSRSRSD